MGSCVPKRDIPRFIALYQRGKLPVQKLRSGFVTFEQLNEGFDRLADGAVLRQVLRPTHESFPRHRGAGFIGSHLCDALIVRGDTVRVLDDFSTGIAPTCPTVLN